MRFMRTYLWTKCKDTSQVSRTEKKCGRTWQGHISATLYMRLAEVLLAL